jgi:hypothetical protein
MVEPSAGKLSIDSLESMTVNDLKSVAKSVGVAASGNKGDIVVRLMQAGATSQDLPSVHEPQPMVVEMEISIAKPETPPTKRQKTGAEGSSQKNTADSDNTAAKKTNTDAAGGSVKDPAIGGDSAPVIPVASPPGHPVKPTLPAKNSAWSGYYQELVRYVKDNLKSELKKSGLDISQHGELHHVPPTNIETNTSPAIGGAHLTTFRETWNIQRCQQAMQSTGKYEAAGSLWWMNLGSGGKVVFQGQTIFDVEPDRAAVEAAAVLWDEAAFKSSDLTEHRRRFDLPGVVPTACVGLPDAQRTAGENIPTFKDLPMMAGRQCVLALFEAIYECMQSNLQQDKQRLLKLFEARELL